MLCLGARKKPTSRKQSFSGQSQLASDASVAQIKQEYDQLKTKNLEHLVTIEKQNSELLELREKLNKSISSQNLRSEDDTSRKLLELETRNKRTLEELAEKETQLEQSQKYIEDLLKKVNIDNSSDIGDIEKEVIQTKLLEKEKLLHDKEVEMEELKSQWQAERAELVKPALDQVTAQLEELKHTNKIVVERLAEKEGELAELHAELNRRDRKPKQASKEQERQKRLNRLTVDLENDRLLMQRLDDLNQQLEAQKKKHEAVLESHAKAIEEKDKALLQHQKSLKQLKLTHENATKALEQEKIHNVQKLELKHQKEMTDLQKRLKQAELHAKTNVNDELDQLLVEFEQSQHNHSLQVANLTQSYEDQMTRMKQGQQTEIKNLLGTRGRNAVSPTSPKVSKLRDTGKFAWPPVAV